MFAASTNHSPFWTWGHLGGHQEVSARSCFGKKNDQGGGAHRFIPNKALQGVAVMALLSLCTAQEDLHEAGGAEAPRTQSDAHKLGQGSCTTACRGCQQDKQWKKRITFTAISCWLPSKAVVAFNLPKQMKTPELQMSKNPWVLKYLPSYWIGWPENYRSLNGEMGFL